MDGADRKVIEAAPDVAQPDLPIGVQWRRSFRSVVVRTPRMVVAALIVRRPAVVAVIAAGVVVTVVITCPAAVVVVAPMREPVVVIAVPRRGR